MPATRSNAVIAHLVEQLPCKHQVRGSSPRGSTIYKYTYLYTFGRECIRTRVFACEAPISKTQSADNRKNQLANWR